ncbi:RNA-binding protein [Marinilongibacter aquaticus]|uniref:RNA recognition motif domain-containing protein n=1 Tax=Marinilongibacter aquaticus TaxID=2975157 RepID=UPI0021BD10EC|nr:RNA-binding protein [Marinilongibacter aquaticus]UBM60837.1 RNA-binding protein [Marinilongibacter aquaticus]
MDIFVTNLPFKITEEELKNFFETYGTVEGVNLVKDHKTRQNKGYGFVSMPNEAEGKKAIAKANGSELGGRNISVSLSQKKEEKKEETKNALPFWKRKVKPKQKLVTFDGDKEPEVRKKKKGQGRGTKY